MKYARMYLFTIFISVFIGFSSNVHAKLSKEDLTFVEHHRLPEGGMKLLLDETFSKTKQIQEALEQNGFVFLRRRHQIVAYHPKAPEYLVKAIPENSYKINFFSDRLNIGRVEIADQIQTIVKEQNFHGITVPRKYLYHIPGRGSKLNDRHYLVVAEKLDLVDEQESKRILQNLSMHQVDALYTIIRNVGLYDARPSNIVVTTRGEIAFIDTEPRWHFTQLPLIGGWIKHIVGKQGAKRFYNDLKRSLAGGNDEKDTRLLATMILLTEIQF